MPQHIRLRVLLRVKAGVKTIITGKRGKIY
jgi:hypothetical protein